jgi:hypothetical protein
VHSSPAERAELSLADAQTAFAALGIGAREAATRSGQTRPRAELARVRRRSDEHFGREEAELVEVDEAAVPVTLEGLLPRAVKRLRMTDHATDVEHFLGRSRSQRPLDALVPREREELPLSARPREVPARRDADEEATILTVATLGGGAYVFRRTPEGVRFEQGLGFGLRWLEAEIRWADFEHVRPIEGQTFGEDHRRVLVIIEPTRGPERHLDLEEGDARLVVEALRKWHGAHETP